MTLPDQSRTWAELPAPARETWEKLVAEVNLPPLFMETARGKLDPSTYDPHQIAKLAEQDPVLGARLLAVANSATFGLVNPLSSIPRAVVHLGMRLVESVILSYHLETSFSQVPAFPRLHLEFARAWAAASSVLAQHIASGASGMDPGTIATGALLSRLGVLLLGLGRPRPGAEYLQAANCGERLRLEVTTWGVTSCMLSWLFLNKMGLPGMLADWALHSDDPLAFDLPAGDEQARALTVIAMAKVLAVHYITQHAIIPGVLLEDPAYHVLACNLQRFELYRSATEVLGTKTVRRELEGACMQA